MFCRIAESGHDSVQQLSDKNKALMKENV